MVLTLGRKFTLGLATVGVVVVSSGLSIRLLGKAALFHHLERDHLGVVMQASQALDRVLEGGRLADQVPRAQLVADVRRARELAQQATSELFPIEQAAFAFIGFGEILRQPRDVIAAATRVEARLAADTQAMLTPETARQVAPDIALMRAASDRFGPLVAEATQFIGRAAMGLTFVPLAALLLVFQRLRASTLPPIEQVAQAASRMSQGDLSPVELPRSADELGRLAQAVDAMRASLGGLVAQVRDRSAALDQAVHEVSQGSQDLTTRTERQAATLQQTAAGVSELAGALQSSTQQVERAERVAGQARELALQGGEVVQRAIARMDEVLVASRRIADINGVVDGIAFQTNVLALNASVEASRAGEAGRGFAVVAGEVRGLAQRCAAAAQEIAALIADTVAKVETGAHEVNTTGETMRSVVASVEQVSGLTTELARGLAQQRQGITQIDGAMRELDGATQQNAALAEQSAAAAESVRGQSQALVQAVGRFNLA